MVSFWKSNANIIDHWLLWRKQMFVWVSWADTLQVGTCRSFHYKWKVTVRPLLQNSQATLKTAHSHTITIFSSPCSLNPLCHIFSHYLEPCCTVLYSTSMTCATLKAVANPTYSPGCCVWLCSRVPQQKLYHSVTLLQLCDFLPHLQTGDINHCEAKAYTKSV